jgi:multidrug efflux pump subunit AcrB
LPSGTAKIGDTQYTVRTNAVPATIDDLNNIPVKYANGATVFIKDLGYVRDGSLVQQNVVRSDGRRSVLLSVIKNGDASTVDVVRGVKEALKVARASAPPGMEVKELFDQSVFVSASVESLRRRQYDDNIEITGRDLRERTPLVGQRDFFDRLGSSRA